MKQLFARNPKDAATKPQKKKVSPYKRGQMIHTLSLIVFMVIGVYLLGRSIAGSPPAPSSSCGARVSTDSYKVPFGPNAPWNIPACYLPQMTGTFASKWVNNFWSYSHGEIYSTDSNISHDPSNFITDFGLWQNPALDYSIPLYDAASTTDGATTTKHVRIRVGAYAYGTNMTSSDTVPWNPDWTPSRGSDHFMTIINSKTGQEWDMALVATDNSKLVGDDNVNQCIAPQAVTTYVNGGWQTTYNNWDPASQLCVSGAEEVKNPVTGNPVDYNTYEGNSPGSRGGGTPTYAMLTTPEEVQSGEIRHALPMAELSNMFGPTCTAAQLADGSSLGNTCGDAYAPAGQFESSWLTTGIPNFGGGQIAPTPPGTASADAPNAIRNETIPEGTRFALNIDDTYINNWVKSRGYTGQRAQTAKVFAEALRDYGWIIGDTTTFEASIQLDSSDNPAVAAQWKTLLGIPAGSTDDATDLLQGLIQKNNIYVVAPPVNQCADGTTSTYACPATQSLYPQVGPGAHTTMAVPSVTPPVVNITAPANKALVSSNANICVQVNATSSTTSITNVALYENTTLVTNDNVDSPSTLGGCNGYHTYRVPNLNVNTPVVFTAIVTDSQNQQTRSVPVVVYPGTAKVGDAIPAYPAAPTGSTTTTPGTPPAAIAITAPTPGSTLTSSSLPLAATIVNATCSYNQVQYFNGTTSLGVSTTAPTFSVSSSNLAAGSYNVTAIATGLGCTKLTSGAVKVTLQAPPAPANKPPTVSLTSSVTTVPSTGNVVLTANASDDHGITKAEFYDGTSLIGSAVTTAPYVVTITNPIVGKHTYTAKVYDNGTPVLSTTSTPVVVTVTSVTPPAVTLQPPTGLGHYLNFDGFKWHYGVVLQWNAGTAKNGIKDYVIKRNGVQIGTTTTHQFGDYTIANDQTYTYSIYTQDKTTNLLSAGATVKTTTDCDASLFGLKVQTFICSLK